MALKKELKRKDFRNGWEKLLLNFQLTEIKLNAHLRESLKKYGITYQQYNVLQVIPQSKSGIVSNQYIKDRMVQKDADISRLLVRLVSGGLILKTPKKTDKRQSEIQLSERGKELLKEIETEIHLVDHFFYALSKKEAKLFNALLNKIRKG